LKFFTAVLLLILCGCSAAPSLPPAPESGKIGRDSLYRTVVALAAEGGNLGRFRALQGRIDELGLTHLARTEPIDWFSLQNNLLIEVPGTTPRIVYLTAHYDKTDANPLKFLSLLLNGALDEFISWSFLSQGAIDNATGVAVALELAAALSESPPGPFTYRILFPGAEESGMRGSRAHVARLSKQEKERILIAVNIDSVGVAFSPNCVTTGISDEELVEQVGTLADSLGVYLGQEPFSPGLSSDYVPFQSASFSEDFLLGLETNLVGGLLPQRSWFTSSHELPVLNFSACNLFDGKDYLAYVLHVPFARLHGPRDNLQQVDLARLHEQFNIGYFLLRSWEEDPSLIDSSRY